MIDITEEMLKSPILNEKWIFYGYRLGLKKPENLSHEDFLLFCKQNMQPDVIKIVTQIMIESDSVVTKKYLLSGIPKEEVYLASIRKNPTSQVVWDEDYNYHLLVRFVDMAEKSIKKAIEFGGFGTIEKDPCEEREYNFSPIQMFEASRIIPNVETGLNSLFGIKSQEITNSFHFNEDNKPIVQESDGVGYMIYPIEKRAELFSKYPKVDKTLFGWVFKDFVSWILSKSNENSHMKKYCSEVENILYKYKIDKLKKFKTENNRRKLLF